MTLAIRPAHEEDLGEILRMLAAEALRPEDVGPPAPACYLEAFRAMQSDPDNRVYVAESDGRIAGTFQLTFIRHLMRSGTPVAQIEAVRVEPGLRNRGVGARMMRWAIERARERGCSRVQLTSDKRRGDAHRFYQRLGFARSHEGFKLAL